MEKNLPLLRKTMDHIHAHPEEHDQGQWVNACGTAMCFAGHAALLAGADFDPAKAKNNWFINKATGAHMTSHEVYDSGGTVRYEHVSDFAERKLGLSPFEAATLFDAQNSVEKLEELVTALENDEDIYQLRWKG